MNPGPRIPPSAPGSLTTHRGPYENAGDGKNAKRRTGASNAHPVFVAASQRARISKHDMYPQMTCDRLRMAPPRHPTRKAVSDRERRSHRCASNDLGKHARHPVRLTLERSQDNQRVDQDGTDES